MPGQNHHLLSNTFVVRILLYYQILKQENMWVDARVFVSLHNELNIVLRKIVTK